MIITLRDADNCNLTIQKKIIACQNKNQCCTRKYDQYAAKQVSDFYNYV